MTEASRLDWPSKEAVAREIRRAMLDNPTDDSFNERAKKREAIADEAAEVILARFEVSRAEPLSPGTPVAWRTRGSVDGYWMYFDHEPVTIKSREVEPLYAAPSSGGQASASTADHESEAVHGPSEALQCRELDWGKLVQCLLRIMDHAPKGQNSREQAESMADAVIALLQPPKSGGTER